MQDTLILPASELAAIPASRTDADADWAPRSAPRVQLPRLAVRRILLPFDLTRSSVCALRAVTKFAERAGASIYLLHVVKPGDQPEVEPSANRADDFLAEMSGRLLKHWVKRVVQGRVPAFVNIGIGDPVEAIAARAVATRADLIVMTSRSCSGLKNELQRSSAERVSRLAACPVLTIPEKCGDQLAYSVDGFVAGNWRTILMPVDYSVAAERALPAAADLARGYGATLLLARGAPADDLDEMSVQLRLRSWAEQILGGEVPFDTTVWPGGHSLYAILSEAIRSEADLIVLPTRTQSWATRLRAGSITDGILRQAPCPVLSINETIELTED